MKTTQSQSITYDVIISGGGPVGLFLACELALAKCAVLILEKAEHAHSPLKQLPFGIRGLSAPTIEALYRRNLLGELHIHTQIKNPHKTTVTQGARRQVGHFAGIPFHEDDVDTGQWLYRLPGSPPTSLISEIQELETVFTRRAESLGVEIKRGHAVTAFHQTPDEVIVQSDGKYFTARWLVGCDGARSVVRKLGGLEFAGTEPEFTGYTTSVSVADPEKLKPGRNVTPTGMYLQSQPGYIMIQDFDGGAFHSSGKMLTIGHVQDVLRRVSNTDVTLTALHTGTTWTDRARQATAYRDRRVLLAGDAAHIHSPLGGQGLNLGLGDAMNLGWKLAATIKNKAPEGLLDSYYSERHPVGAQVLDWSRAQVAVMGTSPQSRALYAVVKDLVGTRDGATYFAGRVWGINTRYHLGGKHPLVGRSVPDFELNEGTRIGALMYGGHALVLDFEGHPALKTLASEYRASVRHVCCGAKEQLGLSAVLVRPDGIIAWVADSKPDYKELKKEMLKWFVFD